MDHEDNLIYVICKGNDGNYYIEDKKNNRFYKFQTYHDIRDENPDPTCFQLDNCVHVNEFPPFIGKVVIYKRITNSAPRESKKENSYGWKAIINIREETSVYLKQKSFASSEEEGGFSFLNEPILKSIWTKMRW